MEVFSTVTMEHTPLGYVGVKVVGKEDTFIRLTDIGGSSNRVDVNIKDVGGVTAMFTLSNEEEGPNNLDTFMDSLTDVGKYAYIHPYGRGVLYGHLDNFKQRYVRDQVAGRAYRKIYPTAATSSFKEEVEHGLNIAHDFKHKGCVSVTAHPGRVGRFTIENISEGRLYSTRSGNGLLFVGAVSQELREKMGWPGYRWHKTIFTAVPRGIIAVVHPYENKGFSARILYNAYDLAMAQDWISSLGFDFDALVADGALDVRERFELA